MKTAPGFSFDAPLPGRNACVGTRRGDNGGVKRGLVLVGLFAAGLVAAVFLTNRRESAYAPPPRRNVVLITVDTLRADRVGRGLTPNIDRLAARGVSHENVRANVPLTLPSHVSLMTGTIPPLHGVRENGVVFDRKIPTLARVFKEEGYRTGAFVGAYVLNRRFGLDEGFDTYDDAVRRDPERTELLEAERPAGEVVDAAVRWLGAGRPAPGTTEQPFFLWVHMYDPHAPYVPPAEYLTKARGNAYDGEVAYADAQIGRLLDAIDAHGFTDRTSFVVTSDHGESLGEHGEQTHGMLVYEATARVPLVFAPRSMDAPPVRQEAISLTEVHPMLVFAAFGRVTLGRCGGAARCDVYTESMYPRRAGWHALTSLADDQWKLIASSEIELYDLRSDPSEERNIAAANQTVVQAMSAQLAKLRSARTASAAPAEAAERLRSLGYASGSSVITSDDRDAPNPARQIGAWTEFERALGLLHEGKAAEALRILRPLAEKHPGAPVFQSTYAQALRESGDARAALAVYRRAVAKWTTDPALFHDLAAAAREAGQLDEALRAGQAALALDSNSAMAHNGVGLLHADAGRTSEAIAAFERASALDPANASYWSNLGNAKAAAGDAPGAEAAYRTALQHDPEFLDALNGLGVLYVQSGRARDAVPLLERAVRRDASFHEARLNLGIAYQESGQSARAAETYRDILATAPPSAKREREAARSLLKGLQ